MNADKTFYIVDHFRENGTRKLKLVQATSEKDAAKKANLTKAPWNGCGNRAKQDVIYILKSPNQEGHVTFCKTTNGGPYLFQHLIPEEAIALCREKDRDAFTEFLKHNPDYIG
jgi:hypothetical protein